MNRVLTSAGLLALGAASLCAYDSEMSRQQGGGPFTVAATIRGFYDDNINTSPDNVTVFDTKLGHNVKAHPRDESFGYQVSPSAHLNIGTDQSFISLGYVYGLNWYDNREPDRYDQSHEFSGKLRHEFSPTHNIGVDDSFVMTTEPTVVDRFGFITAPQRTRSSILQNHGSIEDNIGLTRLFSLSLGYGNNWYDYEAKGAGSRSALLDRIEHSVRADLRYQVDPKLVALVGYTFGLSSFTGNDFLNQNPAAEELALNNAADAAAAISGKTVTPAQRSAFHKAAFLKSSVRDSYSHEIYVGVDYDITAKLRATVRVGAQIFDYHEIGETDTSPYADASLTYSIRPGTSAELGVRHSHSATDVSSVDGSGRPGMDAESTAVYAQLQHQILNKLTGTLLAQYQLSEFNFGNFAGNSDKLWLVGVNFAYIFNRHFSAEAGYNYDQLESDIKGRHYDRNRYYIGLRATY